MHLGKYYCVNKNFSIESFFMSRIENPQTVFGQRWNNALDSGFPNDAMQFKEQYKGKDLIIRPVLLAEEFGVLGVVNPFAGSRLDVVVTLAEPGRTGHYHDLLPVKQQLLMYAGGVLGSMMRQNTSRQKNADGELLLPDERVRVVVEGYAMSEHEHVGVKTSSVRREGVNDYGFQVEGAPPKWPHDEASLDAMQQLLLVEGDRAVQLNQGLAALASVGSQLIIDLK